MSIEVPPKNTIQFRTPRLEDAVSLRQLIQECPPLDVNSGYLYLLMSHHFNATCLAAEVQGRLAGAVTAYMPPAQPDTLFVWQIAVADEYRGQGLARRMIEEILRRPVCRSIQHLEATVTPSNNASRNLFKSLAKSLGAHFSETALFTEEHLGRSGHEAEGLVRIGPFRIDANFLKRSDS